MPHRIFQIGDWIVRPQRDCVERDGEFVHLKPKAMAVLYCLVRAGGRVVTRDELFDAVWPGGVVSDATLTQCVVELRQAFGDSARDPQIIETVPKIGFRLIPPVTALDHPSADHATGPSIAAPAGPSAAAGTRIRWLLAVVGVIAASLLAWYLASYRESPSRIDDGTVVNLVVLSFEDLSEDQSLGWIANGLAEELTNQLANVDGLQVMGRAPSSRVANYEYKSVELGDIADEHGIEYVLEGSVRGDKHQLRIAVKLVNARNGFQVWARTFDRPLKDIVAVQAELAEAVAFALGITFDLPYFPGLTSSVQAFYLGQEGDHMLLSAWKEGSAQSMLEGIKLMKRAVTIDPEYGLAWGGLAHWYAWTACLEDDRVKLDWLALSAQAAEKARLFWPDLPGEAGLAVNRFTRKRQWAEADKVMTEAWDRGASGNPYSLYFWGIFQGHVGRIEEALTALQSSRLKDPQGPDAGPCRDRFIARMYLLQGRNGDALEAYERAWNENMMVPRLGSFDGLAAALAFDDRETILKWLARGAEHAFTDERPWFLAMTERLEDPPAALGWLHDADQRAAGGSAGPLMDPFIMNWAAYFGDTALALKAMRRSPDPLWFWAPLMAETRSRTEFRDIVRELGLVGYWRDYGWGDFCHPVGDDDFACD
jgi:TolB-like protein/DNA-binding winged helix-turn-helix (wHTH) protein